MPVEQLEISRRSAFADRRTFGGNTFERLDGFAHYAIDPGNPANAPIVDLALATPDADGLVRFSGDVTLLLPHGGGNGAALLDVPNRGHRVAPRVFNGSLVTDDALIEPGDGFLFEQGWTLAFCGWQWDVPRDEGRLGLRVPMITPDVAGAMQLRLQPGTAAASVPLTDQHVGVIGRHAPIPADPRFVSAARLYVKDAPHAEARLVPRQRWQFEADAEGALTQMAIAGGFAAGRVYDLVYTPRECPVVGAGLLALRDFAAFLKSGDTVAAVNHVIGEGVSQCGRCLRTLLYHGLNLDERGDPAFDGLLIHVAGGRRGEFNHRYAQPSVQPTPGFGHLAPFVDQMPGASGLLDVQRARGGTPKIVYTDTAAEYWRGDASLAHTDPATGGDIALPDNVRRYLWASTQHSAGTLPPGDATPFARAANLVNVIDYRPLMRATLTRLLEWVRDGVEPPASAYPRHADGTAVTREEVLDGQSTGRLRQPEAGLLNRLYPLDLGAAAHRGLGAFPARIAGPAYPAFVSKVDADGNEVAGVRMPDVEVPVGVHTGFNPRHTEAGGAGQLVEYTGSTVFFPRAELDRRYGNREGYLERVAAAAEALVSQRRLLIGDVKLCIDLAAARYDAALAAGASE